MFPFDFMFEFDIMFEFDLIFEFDIMFEFDMFVLDIVGIAAGLAAFVLVLLVLLAVLFAVPPQAAANTPIANTAISAIVFIMLRDLLSSSMVNKLFDCLQPFRLLAQT